jgi:Skp family chaperone for outer membrane proteins
MKFHYLCQLLIFAIWSAGLTATAAQSHGEKTFADADNAVAALIAAVNAHDRTALEKIFGPELGEITASEPAQAEEELTQFAAKLNESHQLTKQSETRSELEIGKDQWPFPVPLVKTEGGWFFDTDAGKEEIINRRIGRNELGALESVRAYVEAQREYASRDRDGDGVLEYAQKILSSPEQKDGLYWPEDTGGELSPIGPLIAEAQGKGYLTNADGSAGPQPYRGYYFRILKSQGQNAPGGKYDYIINGNMIGGFALVAYPAEYGESGIMTFIVNQQGRVYQKNLGPDTARIASKITSYDPDNTWTISPD